ncbi:MAG TPA: galactokinase [Verrucomicrobiae bacterium]|nr:galactokinase [Verrucomicrobiae bacterium]
MIITRTPFRLTLGGGGTDLPSFYAEHGGFILAMGIDKYMYLAVNTPIVDDKIRVRYTTSELVDNVEQVEHTLAREALRYFNISTGVEIVSIADVPAGTGLGSSSCYMVGLLNGLHALMQRQATPWQLAEEACHIELDVLQKPIGKQDQYMAAFGGLTTLEIAPDGVVRVAPLNLGVDLVEALENNLLLFFTGETRNAASLLAQQDQSTKDRDKRVVSSLLEIRDIGIEIRNSILCGDLRRFGELLDVHWQSKKRLSTGITNPQIDAWYELAKYHGAIGGKISGAGGGGFLMLYCEGRKAELREAMRRAGLRELRFRIEFEGSKVVFDIVSRDGRLAHLARQSPQPFIQAMVTA